MMIWQGLWSEINRLRKALETAEAKIEMMCHALKQMGWQDPDAPIAVTYEQFQAKVNRERHADHDSH